MKVNNRKIKAKLMATGKFNTVRFSRVKKGQDKWSVYLKPKTLKWGVHFHISYVDGGFISQDEVTPGHRQYYNDTKLIKLHLHKTPLGAINEIRQCLNDGRKIIKL